MSNHPSKYKHITLIAPRRVPGGNTNPNPSFAPGSGGEDPGINFGEIWKTIQQGKWIILGTCVLITAAIAAYTLVVPPTYEASSVVAVDTRGGFLPGVEAPVEGRSVTTEMGVLSRSSELALRVATKMEETAAALGSKEHFPILQAEEGEAPPTTVEVAGLVAQNMKFIPSSTESMVIITAASSSPEEAARIANLYAEEYKTFSQENSRASIVAARTFLEQQVAQMQRELGSLENQWESYAQNRQFAVQGQGGERLVAEYTDLVAQRDEKVYQLQIAQNEKKLFEGELSRIRPDLVNKVASGLQLEIEEIEKKIVDLSLQAEPYYKVNPSLRGNEAQAGDETLKGIIAEIKHWKNRQDQLTKRLTDQTLSSGAARPGGELELAASLTNNINEARLNISRLQYEIDRLEERIGSFNGRIGTLPRQTIEVAQLERKQAIVEEFLKTYQTELQKHLVAEQSDLGYVSIVRPAFVPIAPVRPDLKKNLMLALLVGLMLGTGLAFVRGALRQRLEKPEDLQALGYSLVGVIPPMDREIKSAFQGKSEVEVDGKLLSTQLVTMLNPWSTISENYRLVRTNLQHGKFEKPPQMLLVTSPEPSDGKTVNAVNVAITMAQSGSRTLLIDADVRRPNAHKMLGVKKSPGLAELLEGSGDGMPYFDSFTTNVQGLYFIPAGSTSTPPPELFGLPRMGALLAEAREMFDAIVIDSPPVLAATDALLLATMCDATVVVVSANRTEPRALNAVRAMLDSVGVRIAGTIMNRFDSTQAGNDRYGYGYGYGYKYDYTKS